TRRGTHPDASTPTRREADGMTTHNQTPPSAVEALEHDAELAGAAVAGGLSAIDLAAITLLVLLVCPPLAILAFVVLAPLFVAALAVGLLVFVLSIPYLLVHHFRAGHGDHLSLLRQRIPCR